MYREEGGFRPRNRFSPVKEGDELDVTIEAVGEKGDGIAKKEGFVIFVPGAKEGSTVHIKISRVLKNMAFAEVTGKASSAPAKDIEPEEEQEQEGSEDFGDDESEEEEPSEDSEDFGDDESEEETKQEDEDSEEEDKKED